jgi:transcriptional regulator with XRE-family HTH domain
MVARLMTIQEFILSELRRLDISARELARRADISSTTLVRILDERNPRTPDLETLEKLSKATGHPLLTLVRLVKPDAADVDPEALVMARRIQALPEATRKALEELTRISVLGNKDQAEK